MENQVLQGQAVGADSMRRDRAWVLPGLMVLYLALRLPWVFTVPSMQAPDEPQHLWIVHYISQHFHSPTPKEVFDSGLEALYGTVPPFGYYIGALVAWLLQGVVPFIVAARLGSVLVGIPSVWAAYAVGKEIFNTRFLSLCLPLLVVVHPQLVFTQSYCNSDGTLISLSAIAMLITVRCLKYGADVKKALLLGCTIGGAALAKTNGSLWFRLCCGGCGKVVGIGMRALPGLSGCLLSLRLGLFWCARGRCCATILSITATCWARIR
jgi:4-amino-4-deoxy-L-arabinose transferase-like glycosyltransferase